MRSNFSVESLPRTRSVVTSAPALTMGLYGRLFRSSALFLSRFARKTSESKEAPVPRVKLTYCNPPQKHIVAGGRAEGGTLFCVLARGVSGPMRPQVSLPSSIGPYDR
jgi:hypothetical protein